MTFIRRNQTSEIAFISFDVLSSSFCKGALCDVEIYTCTRDTRVALFKNVRKSNLALWEIHSIYRGTAIPFRALILYSTIGFARLHVLCRVAI